MSCPGKKSIDNMPMWEKVCFLLGAHIAGGEVAAPESPLVPVQSRQVRALVRLLCDHGAFCDLTIEDQLIEAIVGPDEESCE